ncbi:hypothetical protein ACFOMD_05645 [Sphingoaurantiacus capsulatus]|uniref:DUF3667 domain-containing protein n=1 Tax=Sphingoaurantiacus capsulatus TaxID=1771310 RepID=A0ABV7X9Y4_9SPHN
MASSGGSAAVPDAAAAAAPESWAPTACPYCGEPGTGRFCSACGKPMALQSTSRAELREVLGVKLPPVAAILYTAWLAVSSPACLSRRWVEGDRRGLVSPVAMISSVTALTALIGFILSRWTGNRPAGVDDTETAKGVLGVAGFLVGLFPDAFAAAAADPAAFAQHFKSTGQLLVLFWPVLFIIPGFVMLAPWTRVPRHRALVMAAFETVFVMLLAGLHGALQAVESVRGLGLSTLFWLALWAHSAAHVRFGAETSWRYALSRPPLAALIFLPVVYIWVTGVAALALTSWSLTG